MKPEASISTTKLSRTLSTWIDHVQISGEKVLISKGSRIVATLGPPPKPEITMKTFLKRWEKIPRLENTEAFIKDIKILKQKAKIPKNPWA